MQREIKFRAWNNIRKRMIEWAEITSRESDLVGGLTATLNGKPYYTWMQYTGLKDKNGKEIYESDLVDDGINTPFEVIWDYPLLARLSEIEIKVIGNKYEVE